MGTTSLVKFWLNLIFDVWINNYQWRYPSQDSSVGSISAWYCGGPRFKTQQGQELFNENENYLNLNCDCVESIWSIQLALWYMVDVLTGSCPQKVTMKHAVCIVLSSQKIDLESRGSELGTFQFQTQLSTTESTSHIWMSKRCTPQGLPTLKNKKNQWRSFFVSLHPVFVVKSIDDAFRDNRDFSQSFVNNIFAGWHL